MERFTERVWTQSRNNILREYASLIKSSHSTACLEYSKEITAKLKVISEVVDSILSPENHRVFRSAIIDWKIGYKEILEKIDLEKFLWISLDV